MQRTLSTRRCSSLREIGISSLLLRRPITNKETESLRRPLRSPNGCLRSLKKREPTSGMHFFTGETSQTKSGQVPRLVSFPARHGVESHRRQPNCSRGWLKQFLKQSTNKHHYDKRTRELPELKTGSPVYVQLHLGTTKLWSAGRVLDRLSERSYLVDVEGAEYRRSLTHVKPPAASELRCDYTACPATVAAQLRGSFTDYRTRQLY